MIDNFNKEIDLIDDLYKIDFEFKNNSKLVY